MLKYYTHYCLYYIVFFIVSENKEDWANMLDEQLKSDINSRDKLLNLGAEHPSIN